jgi:hypothetical protein
MARAGANMHELIIRGGTSVNGSGADRVDRSTGEAKLSL